MGKAEVLLSLHESAAHNEQVEAWQADLRAFEELKEDHESELRKVRGEAYEVTTLYAMFQGVMLTAVSQSNLLTCSLSWCPASLSLLASAAAFLAIADKLKSMGEVHEDIKEASLNMSALMDCLDQVDLQGSEFDLETELPQVEFCRSKLAGYRFVFSARGVFPLLFLALFAILITCFYVSTICKHCSHCLPR